MPEQILDVSGGSVFPNFLVKQKFVRPPLESEDKAIDVNDPGPVRKWLLVRNWNSLSWGQAFDSSFRNRVSGRLRLVVSCVSKNRRIEGLTPVCRRIYSLAVPSMRDIVNTIRPNVKFDLQSCVPGESNYVY